MTGPGPIDARRASVAALADGTWDVVIVGGGIVGSGALLDAVSRGMRAALIEQDDIAAGTSSRSSRLIHGGLRYLEQFRFGLVREALAERSRILHLAPHLVRLEPLLFPIYGIPFLSKAFYDIGLTMYDVLGARHDGGWHRRLSKAATLEMAPTLRPDGLRGGLLYHDGVEDDARYTLAVARTADVDGGVVVTRVRATGLRTDPAYGTLDAIRAQDLMTGTAFDIRTRAVVDATGVWAAERDHPIGGGSLRILPSRGAHLVVPRARIPNRHGLTIRVPGKIVFLVPWPDHWLIGTTDAPYEGAIRPPGGRWLGGGPAARHGQRHDGRQPHARRRRRHLRGAAAVDRPVRRIDREGVPRASGHGRVERRRQDRWREVHDVPGHGARCHRCGPRPGFRARAPEPDRPNDVSSAPRTRTPSPGSPPSSTRSRRSRRWDPMPRHILSRDTGRRHRAWPAWGRNGTSSVRSCRAACSSRPRSPGRRATSSRCRSTTCWRAGPASRRNSRIGERRSRLAWPSSSARSSGGARPVVRSRWRRTSRWRAASTRWLRPPVRPPGMGSRP